MNFTHLHTIIDRQVVVGHVSPGFDRYILKPGLYLDSHPGYLPALVEAFEDEAEAILEVRVLNGKDPYKGLSGLLTASVPKEDAGVQSGNERAQNGSQGRREASYKDAWWSEPDPLDFEERCIGCGQRLSRPGIDGHCPACDWEVRNG